MSGKKKSPVAIALAYSLTIGRGETDKIKVGVVEAGFSGTGRSEKVVQIDTDYKALAAAYKKIVADLATVADSRKSNFESRRADLEKDLRAFESREVTNVESVRQEMLNDIDAATKRATALQNEITAAINQGSLPVPVITATERIEVTVGTAINLGMFAASVTPQVPIRLTDRSGTAAPITFETMGERPLLIVSDDSPQYQAAQKAVRVNVTTKERVITWTPPASPVPWGTTISLTTLKATATGEGKGLELTPASDTIGVGPVELVVRAPGDGKAWRTAEKRATITVEKAVRRLKWTLPTSFEAGVKVDINSLDLKVLRDLDGKEVELENAKYTITAPPGGIFAAAGDALDLTVEAAGNDVFTPVTITAKVKVDKTATSIAWKEPGPITLGTKLGGGTLNAAVTPDRFKSDLVYAPASGTTMNTAGATVLAVSLAETPTRDAAEASVRLMVVRSANEEKGMKAAMNGTAFDPPTDEKGAARLDEWNNSDEDDPEAIGTMGKALMNKITKMSQQELVQFFEDNKDEDTVAKFVDLPGKKVLSFKNGLEIRYKPNGSDRNGHKPSFCMEVRKDLTKDVSTDQDGVAFKVAFNGTPAPKGPGQLKTPGTLHGASRTDFQDGAHASTHLEFPT